MILERLVVEIDGNLTGLRKELEQGERRVVTFGKGVAKLTGGLIGVSAAMAAIGRTSREAMRLDSLARGLATVAGSTEAAQRQLLRLRDLATLPGLGFEQVVEGSTNLQAAGLSAELAEAALREMGNALAAVGRGKEDLAGVILALTQIASKGKVTAEEINQIAERVPQIRVVMKEAFGTAATEEIQAMGVTSEEFISRVVTAMGDLGRATKGPQAETEDLGDSFQRLNAELGELLLIPGRPAIRGLTSMFSGLADLLDGMREDAETLADSIGGVRDFSGLSEADLRAELELLERRQDILRTGLQQDPMNEANLAFLRRTSREIQAIQEALAGLGRATPAAAGPGALGISDATLGSLEERLGSLRDKADDLRLDLQFERDAEAAKKLRDKLSEVAAELAKVETEITRQRLGGAGVTGTPLVGPGAAARGLGPLLLTRDRMTKDQLEDFADGVQKTARHLKPLSEETKGLGDKFRDLGRGVLGDLKARFDPTEVLSGAAANLLSGAITSLGSMVLSAIGDLFGPSALEKNTAAIRANTEAILGAIRGQAGGTVGAIGDAISAVLAGPATSQFDLIRDMDRELAKVGLTMDDFARVLKELGLEFPHTQAGFQQIMELLESDLFGALSGRMSLAQTRIGLLDIDDPEAQFREFQKALAQSLPGGLSGLGTSVARLGLDSIGGFAEGILRQIAAGTFDLAQLGDVSLDEFLDVLGQMEALGDSAGEAASALQQVANAINSPSGFKVAFHRFVASDPVSRGLDGSAFLGGGSRRGDVQFSGDIHIHADSEDDGRTLYRKFTDELRTQLHLGGADDFTVGLERGLV